MRGVLFTLLLATIASSSAFGHATPPGNLSSLAMPGALPSYTYTNDATRNRLEGLKECFGAACANYTHTYDREGNQSSDGIYKYTYDAANRLVEVRTQAGALVSKLGYDGLGRRCRKEDAATGCVKFFAD